MWLTREALRGQSMLLGVVMFVGDHLVRGLNTLQGCFGRRMKELAAALGAGDHLLLAEMQQRKQGYPGYCVLRAPVLRAVH